MNRISSLQHTSIVITVASWEDRFLLGMTQQVESVTPSKVLMFHYKEYADWSEGNRTKLSGVCCEKNIELQDIELSFSSPAESWKALSKCVNEVDIQDELITLDISTMPRETIWSICHILSQRKICVQYVYHKPQENGYAEWLSRDPGRPRILYRLAGIQHLGRPTALIIQTGYDVERVQQLVRFYEPEKLLLALQTGEQFENIKQNRQKHIDAFSKRRDTEFFDVDGYSLDNSYETFKEKTGSLIESYNVVISSLGPKVGALSLYRLKQFFPDITMSYAPSNEFNHDYSKGIGVCVYGILGYNPED
jgi:hypothetical protein